MVGVNLEEDDLKVVELPENVQHDHPVVGLNVLEVSEQELLAQQAMHECLEKVLQFQQVADLCLINGRPVHRDQEVRLSGDVFAVTERLSRVRGAVQLVVEMEYFDDDRKQELACQLLHNLGT